MRVFIFGIGGTGSRVLRSLTMLLASGIKLKQEGLTLVPVVIDSDAHNGDTARTRDLLRNYYTIRQSFVNRTANSQSDIFFNTEIRSFSRLEKESTEAADINVQLNFQNQDTSFANFINHNGLSEENKDIIELFYNDSIDEFPELHLNLNVGFKGNPNIGSVVFNDLKNSQQFKNIESSFTANDRVFIISSIFGGTGSAGFPTLVKLIRTSGNNNLATCKIGAITVMPYFNIESKDSSAINSAIFDTKTKAALSFYASDSHINSINALYYIADNNQSGSLPNIEGGSDQKNDGHVVEFISATSIVDFINKSSAELETPACYEFGAEKGESPMSIGHFGVDTKEKYIKSLLRFAYSCQIAKTIIPTLSNSTFYKPDELDIANHLGIQKEYNKILTFFSEFMQWCSIEMTSTNNGRAFYTFNFDSHEHLNTLVYGKTIETGFLKPGLSKKVISERLTKNALGFEANTPRGEKYLRMLYKTSQDCLEKFGQLP